MCDLAQFLEIFCDVGHLGLALHLQDYLFYFFWGLGGFAHQHHTYLVHLLLIAIKIYRNSLHFQTDSQQSITLLMDLTLVKLDNLMSNKRTTRGYDINPSIIYPSLYIYFIMNKPKSSKSSALFQMVQHASEILQPIYSKAELLRRQLDSINRLNRRTLKADQEQFAQTCKHQFLEIAVDRDLEIQKERKLKKTQSKFSTSDRLPKKEALTTVVSWQQNNRNKTKSLINFLSNTRTKQTQSSQSKRERQNNHFQEARNQKFQPLGEEYKKERLFQESLNSQTQSLSSSRNASLSLHSSSALGLRKQPSSKKYLRKGTRVRQILMRQLQTPEQRGSTPSSMTYLKEYDQWVPSALVEQKKIQLQNFMNIIYGQKKAKKAEAVDLETINLIYL